MFSRLVAVAQALDLIPEVVQVESEMNENVLPTPIDLAVTRQGSLNESASALVPALADEC